MIKYLEILEQIFRTATSSYQSGLQQLDSSLGRLGPGVYGFIGPGRYPLHLAMQYMQQNDDVSIYYGYVYPPLSAMYRLTAYGLGIPVAQMLINPKGIARGTGFTAFKLRMRFMQFNDMYETLPIPPVSVGRLAKDVLSVREKEEQLVVLCLDDFAMWLNTSVSVLDPDTADPRRLAISLRDFCQVFQVIVLAPCQPAGLAAEILAEISNASILLQASGENDAALPEGVQQFTLTVQDAIGGFSHEVAYSNELECFLDA